MEAIDLLLNRRSCVVGNMTGPGPSDEELTTILRVGLRVPDHGKLFPWRIQVIKPNAQTKLGEIYAEAFAQDDPEAAAEQIEIERERPTRAPVLLAVSNRITPGHKIPELEQLLSGGALCLNLLNAAHALGYVAQWITEWPAYHPTIKKALGHDLGHDIIGLVHIGAAAIPPTERRRAGLADVVTEWLGPGEEVAFPPVG